MDVTIIDDDLVIDLEEEPEGINPAPNIDIAPASDDEEYDMEVVEHYKAAEINDVFWAGNENGRESDGDFEEQEQEIEKITINTEEVEEKTCSLNLEGNTKVIEDKSSTIEDISDQAFEIEVNPKMDEDENITIKTKEVEAKKSSLNLEDEDEDIAEVVEDVGDQAFEIEVNAKMDEDENAVSTNNPEVVEEEREVVSNISLNMTPEVETVTNNREVFEEENEAMPDISMNMTPEVETVTNNPEVVEDQREVVSNISLDMTPEVETVTNNREVPEEEKEAVPNISMNMTPEVETLTNNPDVAEEEEYASNIALNMTPEVETVTNNPELVEETQATKTTESGDIADKTAVLEKKDETINPKEKNVVLNSKEKKTVTKPGNQKTATRSQKIPEKPLDRRKRPSSRFNKFGRRRFQNHRPYRNRQKNGGFNWNRNWAPNGIQVWNDDYNTGRAPFQTPSWNVQDLTVATLVQLLSMSAVQNGKQFASQPWANDDVSRLQSYTAILEALLKQQTNNGWNYNNSF